MMKNVYITWSEVDSGILLDDLDCILSVDGDTSYFDGEVDGNKDEIRDLGNEIEVCHFNRASSSDMLHCAKMKIAEDCDKIYFSVVNESDGGQSYSDYCTIYVSNIEEEVLESAIDHIMFELSYEDNADEYDEEELKLRLKDEGFVSPVYFISASYFCFYL